MLKGGIKNDNIHLTLSSACTRTKGNYKENNLNTKQFDALPETVSSTLPGRCPTSGEALIMVAVKPGLSDFRQWGTSDRQAQTLCSDQPPGSHRGHASHRPLPAMTERTGCWGQDTGPPVTGHCGSSALANVLRPALPTGSFHPTSLHPNQTLPTVWWLSLHLSRTSCCPL